MAKVKITGHASGTGVVTVTAPNTSTDRTITLPDGTGSLTYTPSIVDGGNATAITIDASENVGIGTTSPQRVVQIQGVDGASGVSYGNSRTSLVLDNNGANYINILTNTSGNGAVFFSDNGSNNGGMVYETPNDDLYFKANNAEKLRLTSDGRGLSAFTAKAWVNFNGTGTVAIRDSHNVSSVTDNGVEDYTINFTNSMANANYATFVTSQQDSAVNSYTTQGQYGGIYNLVSSVRIDGFSGSDSTEARDYPYNTVLVFGD